MRGYLRGKIYPTQFIQSFLRPEIVISFEEVKRIILMKLMDPWDDGCEVVLATKATKYKDLVQQCKDKGWQAWLFTVDVGCRDFWEQSV